MISNQIADAFKSRLSSYIQLRSNFYENQDFILILNYMPSNLKDFAKKFKRLNIQINEPYRSKRYDFNIFSFLEYLDLEYTENFNMETVNSLVNLKTFKLNGKHLNNELPSNIFNNLTSLNELIINECGLHILDKNYFNNLENLVSLSLYPEEEFLEKCVIYDRRVFNNLKNLKSLLLGDISFNCDEFSFENLEKLESLSIRSLCICECNTFAWKFKNVKNFKLRLCCNEREVLRKKYNKIFMEIENEFDEFLTYFGLFSFLDHNLIPFVKRCKQLTLVHSTQSRHCFYGPQKLPLLSSIESCFYNSNCKLSYFDRFEKLEKLELCGYKLDDCRHEILSLKSLIVNSNFDPKLLIKKENFYDLRMLTDLCLNVGYKIKLEIDSSMFDDLINLEKLSISHFCSFKQSSSNGLFKSLNKLKELEIKNCLIDDLQSEFFNGIENIEILCFENNVIDMIHLKSFDNLVNLIKCVFNQNVLINLSPLALSSINKIKNVEFIANKNFSQSNISRPSSSIRKTRMRS